MLLFTLICIVLINVFICLLFQEELMDIHEAGYDAEAHREPDPSTTKRHKENPSLVQLG